MSRIKIARWAVALFFLSACGQSEGREPGVSSEPLRSGFAWSMSHLTDGVAETLTGPNGKLTLEYQGDQVTVIGSRGAVELSVIPPASVLWSPTGNAVAINNGNGSGQMSKPIMVGDNLTPSLISDIERPLEVYFNRETGCEIEPLNLSVSVQGWSVDGSTVWAKIENWDRERFCRDESVYYIQYDLVNRTVLRHLSEKDALDTFCDDAGFKIENEPICSRYHKGFGDRD